MGPEGLLYRVQNKTTCIFIKDIIDIVVKNNSIQLIAFTGTTIDKTYHNIFITKKTMTQITNDKLKSCFSYSLGDLLLIPNRFWNNCDITIYC